VSEPKASLYLCADCGEFSTTDVDAFIDHHLMAHEKLRQKDIVETNYLFWYRLTLVQLALDAQKLQRRTA
jgi:hypothetical protein